MLVLCILALAFVDGRLSEVQSLLYNVWWSMGFGASGFAVGSWLMVFGFFSLELSCGFRVGLGLIPSLSF